MQNVKLGWFVMSMLLMYAWYCCLSWKQYMCCISLCWLHISPTCCGLNVYALVVLTCRLETHNCREFSRMALEPTRLFSLSFGVLSSSALIRTIRGFYVLIELFMELLCSFWWCILRYDIDSISWYFIFRCDILFTW